MPEAVKVKGLREFIRACDKSSADVRRGLRAELRRAAEIVAVEARRRFGQYDANSAAGMRARTRVGGAFVEQTRRRVTGKRPDYGALQMRDALIPALESKRAEVERGVEEMLDRVADKF